MRSLLRSVKKRKKSRVLGEVQVVSCEEYTGLDVDSKVEMIRALVPLGLMQVEELLDEEVKALAGGAIRAKGGVVAGSASREQSRDGGGLGASGCRFGFPGFAAWQAGRFRSGPTMNSVRVAR